MVFFIFESFKRKIGAWKTLKTLPQAADSLIGNAHAMISDISSNMERIVDIVDKSGTQLSQAFGEPKNNGDPASVNDVLAAILKFFQDADARVQEVGPLIPQLTGQIQTFVRDTKLIAYLLVLAIVIFLIAWMNQLAVSVCTILLSIIATVIVNKIWNISTA